MTFKLEIKTNNAAFEDAPQAELARILRDVANTLENDPSHSGTMRDINGNRVGHWSWRDYLIRHLYA